MNETFPGGAPVIGEPVDVRLARLEKGDVVLYTPDSYDDLLLGEPIAGVVVKIHNRTCCSASVNIRLFLDCDDRLLPESRDLVLYKAYGSEGQRGSWRFKSN